MPDALYNETAERAVLGGMMLDEYCRDIAIEKLRAEDFFSAKNRIIFAALLDKKNTDAVCLRETLRASGHDYSISAVYLAELFDNASRTGFDGHVNLVKQYSFRRGLIIAAENITKAARDLMIDDAEMLTLAESAVFNVSDNQTDESMQSMYDIVGANAKEIAKRIESKAEITGVRTGFKNIDNAISGLNRGNLIVLGARPGMGKSALAINIAQNISDGGGNVAYFTLEMTSREILERLISINSGLNMRNVYAGRMHEGDNIKIKFAFEKIDGMNMWIDESPNVNSQKINAKCRRLISKLKSEGKTLDCVIIDHMHLMSAVKKSKSRYEDITEISGALKQTAKALNCPVLALTQLNRAIDAQQTTRKPILSDLRDSGSIEQDADVVMFLHRPFIAMLNKTSLDVATAAGNTCVEDYVCDLYRNKNQEYIITEAQIIIPKNRHGQTASCVLDFDGKTQRFTERKSVINGKPQCEIYSETEIDETCDCGAH